MRAKTKKKAAKRAPRRTRKDPLGEATRAALIEKAEAMFAEKGIDGVSIRQIGIAIGSANSNVVGYHFGTKEALVRAILLKNLPHMATRRAELLDQAKRDGREQDLPALLEALCRPVFELQRADGQHTYGMFLWRLSGSPWWGRVGQIVSVPVTQEILKRMAAALPKLPEKFFMERIYAVADIFTGTLRRLDAAKADERTQEHMFGHAMRMATAVLNMPIGKNDQAGPRRSSGRESISAIKDPVVGA